MDIVIIQVQPLAFAQQIIQLTFRRTISGRDGGDTAGGALNTVQRIVTFLQRQGFKAGAIGGFGRGACCTRPCSRPCTMPAPRWPTGAWITTPNAPSRALAGKPPPNLPRPRLSSALTAARPCS